MLCKQDSQANLQGLKPPRSVLETVSHLCFNIRVLKREGRGVLGWIFMTGVLIDFTAAEGLKSKIKVLYLNFKAILANLESAYVVVINTSFTLQFF